MNECLQHANLSAEVHVVYILMGVVELIASEHLDAPCVTIFQGDEKNLLVSSLDVRKPVLCCCLDVKCEHTDLTRVKLDLICRIFFCNVLIQITSLTTDLKVRDVFMLIHKLSCITNRTLLYRANVLTIQSLPARRLLCGEVQRRVERNLIAKCYSVLISTDVDVITCLLNAGVKLHFSRVSFKS